MIYHAIDLQISVYVPDMKVVKAVQKISWTAAGGIMDLLHCTNEEIHKTFEKVTEYTILKARRENEQRVFTFCGGKILV